MNQSSVTIFFSSPLLPSQPVPPDQSLMQEIQLVESIENQKKVWILKTPQQADYRLNLEESARLLQLCRNITVSAPWKGQMGFDGQTSTLTMKGAMSEMVFSWWGDAPEEWQPVGAVFDFVMGIMKTPKNS